ncbi:serine hydrolase [Pseudorhodoplanes sp.]|uniref:serine hydrolase n=1 Tax=Pseudorhodoplanes sp. TaxID=1934341 RepID=UPI003D0F24F1
MTAAPRIALAALTTLAILCVSQTSAQDIPPPEVAGVPIPDGQIDRAIGQLDALAATIMQRSGIPGMAVAVVRDGRMVYAKGFGVRKAGAPETVDIDTVFQIASLSKPVTATAVARQVQSGIVAWDTPVVKHLPWFRLKEPWLTAHVTIGDLLSHRSGLPDHGGDALEDLGFNRRQILERLRMLPLSPFRISYAYTNFGYTAAAESVAAASGKDWATLCEDVLFKPLGMNATSARFADFEKRANRAFGHVKVGESFEAKDQRRPDAQAPAGGVSSSISDLARWLAMVTEGGMVEGRSFIDGKALLPAMSAQAFSTHTSTFTARPGFYGYGFNVGVTPAGRMSFSHSGAFAMGAGTNLVILPSARVGIVVLTNASPTGAAEALTAEFMDLVQFGRIERDWLPPYAAALAPTSAPVGSLVGKERPATPVPAADIDAYAGTYANDYYAPAQVVRRKDGLILKLGPKGMEYPLAHWDGNAFTFHPSGENAPAGSISLATFKQGAKRRFRDLTIEYLNNEGLGIFRRK